MNKFDRFLPSSILADHRCPMPQELSILEEVQASQEAAPALVPSLDVVLASIRGDAVAGSEEYLRDTVVPHGGE